MHTVIETHAFSRAAKQAGMSPVEVSYLIVYLAEHPDAGDEISGTGGCRKLRRAGKRKGKSGGYRVITFFTGTVLPVFLITVFGKGERANLTKAECNALRAMTKTLVAEFSKPARPRRPRQ